MKKLLLSLGFVSLLVANELVEVQEIQEIESPTINIEYLKTISKGNERDFYINEYLKKDISSEQAYETLSLIDIMQNEMFFNFAKKFQDDETLAVAQCMSMDTKDLVESYANCIVAGLSIRDISTLSAIELDLVKQKTAKKHPIFAKRLKVLSSSIPFTKLIVQKKDEFYNIYFNVSEPFRTKYFNYKLPKRTLAKIFKDKKKFDKFLAISLSNPKLNMIQKQLNGIDDSELNSNSSFLLALNAIRLNDLNSANAYLNNSVLKTNNIKEIDKIKFWQYQITKDEAILEELSNSESLNFYSYLANEMLGKKIKDFSTLQKIETFDNLLEEYDKKRIALLYSIAKTKSNFQSNKISKSFDIGLMQLKPSLIKSISNSLNEEYLILNQFDDKVSLKFANIYLNSLENRFKNPLLLSLAYDGIYIDNFINKVIKDNSLEPFLSLEFILNGEKKINKDSILYYVLYHNSFVKKSKEKISLLSIYQKLIEPAHKLGE